MQGAATGLPSLVRSELTRPAPMAALRFGEELESLLGEAVTAVIFYGSCLRKASTEGVLDFYVVVDSYKRAYVGRGGAATPLAWANALLPPNVFYLEIPGASETLRAKYAVVSEGDFARGVAEGTLRSSLWARFSQPAIAVTWRDEEALVRLCGWAAESIVTTVATLGPISEADGPLDAESFWQRALRETYAAEMRTERPETIASVYASDPQRFDLAARLALEELTKRGRLSLRDGAVIWPPGWRRRARRTWRLRKPLAKAVYFVGLLKSAATFGDWLPYVLWKLERHTGTRLEPTEKQRRHPFIWAWPLLFKALWRRDFH